jgi:hypothetical protein
MCKNLCQSFRSQFDVAGMSTTIGTCTASTSQQCTPAVMISKLTLIVLSKRYVTHVSPTLFNAGTPHPQLSSWFLVCMKEDSLKGIYDMLKNRAMISKTAGARLSIYCMGATGYAILLGIHCIDDPM